MRVTTQNYPHVHEVLEDISHDGGGRAGWAWYEVPDEYESHLSRFEAALAALDVDDRQTFAIGEESEKEEIAARSQDLIETDRMLNEFFEGGWDRGGRG